MWEGSKVIPSKPVTPKKEPKNTQKYPTQKPTIKIQTGQIWEDKDKRRAGRRIKIEGFEGDKVICRDEKNKTTKINKSRFEANRFNPVTE